MGFNLRKNSTSVKRLERKKDLLVPMKSHVLCHVTIILKIFNTVNSLYNGHRSDFISESPYSGSLFLISQMSLVYLIFVWDLTAVRIIEVSVIAGCPELTVIDKLVAEARKK